MRRAFLRGDVDILPRNGARVGENLFRPEEGRPQGPPPSGSLVRPWWEGAAANGLAIVEVDEAAIASDGGLAEVPFGG